MSAQRCLFFTTIAQAGLLFLFSCGNGSSTSVAKGNTADSSVSKQNIPQRDPFLDSMKALHFDTTTYSGHVAYLVNQFNIEHYPTMPCTGKEFLDLNFDGTDDLIIHYTYAAGTGLRTSTKVYLYHPNIRQFTLDSTISNLCNPSFFVEKKQVSSFYIGTGSGEGILLQWRKQGWDTLYQLDFEPRDSGWKITRHKGHNTTVQYSPWFGIPPAAILPNMY